VIRSGGGVEFWLSRLVDRIGIPLITGALGTGEEHGESLYTNAAYLVVPDSGIVSRYDKLHLVPFSEKMPFSRHIPFLKELNLGQGDYAHGDSVALFNIRDMRGGILICFEAILPALVRKHIRAGAEVLITITNDSWFGDTGAPEQHAAMAVIRSVEYRRWLIRSANSGVSLIADPWGRITHRSGLFRQEFIIGEYAPRNDMTWYARYGDWIVWVSIAFSIFALISRYWRQCENREFS
jgi:apolipoprotein N-acyltransferase